MNEQTPSPTWDEYLAEATAYLHEVRRTAERGARPPAPPARPVDPIPDGCRETARRLAAGYDLLAEELVGRMSAIERRRPSTTRLHAPRDLRLPRYINTPV
jgi:hypothetical protein